MDGPARIFETMRRAGAEGAAAGALRLRLGKVLAPSPLKVEVAGTTQEAARFYISHRLVAGHGEALALECAGVSGSLAVSASCSFGSHNRMAVSGGTLSASATATQAGPVLKAGDLVLLLTDDDQTFYLIDKVVRAT